MGNRFLVLATACVASFVVSACGGGGGDSGEVTVSSLSKAQYVRNASEVCEHGTKQIEVDYGTWLKTLKEKPTEADYSKLVDTAVVGDIGQEIDELRELGAPKGDAKEIETVLQLREESIQIAEEDPEAVIENADKVFAKASKAASEYGLQACATR